MITDLVLMNILLYNQKIVQIFCFYSICVLILGTLELFNNVCFVYFRTFVCFKTTALMIGAFFFFLELAGQTFISLLLLILIFDSTTLYCFSPFFRYQLLLAIPRSFLDFLLLQFLQLQLKLFLMWSIILGPTVSPCATGIFVIGLDITVN